MVPVRKKIGQIRLCVKFCALNRDSVKDNFLLPNMEIILQQVARSQIMSLLDSFSVYNQIRVMNPSKSIFRVTQGKLLGHIVSDKVLVLTLRELL
jgi:hypothetical protein